MPGHGVRGRFLWWASHRGTRITYPAGCRGGIHVVGPRSAVLGVPALVDILDGPASVPSLRQHHYNTERLIHGHCAPRWASETPMLQRRPQGIVSPTSVAKHPFRDPSSLRGLRHRSVRRCRCSYSYLKAHRSHLLMVPSPVSYVTFLESAPSAGQIMH